MFLNATFKSGALFASKDSVVAKKLKSTLFWRLFFQTHLRLPLPLIKLRYGSVWPQGDLTHFVVQYNVDPGHLPIKLLTTII